MIGSAQRVEHYEIAGYGTAKALALKLGHEEIAELLNDTLPEEIATDAQLTEIAESAVVNEEQAGQDEDAGKAPSKALKKDGPSKNIVRKKPLPKRRR